MIFPKAILCESCKMKIKDIIKKLLFILPFLISYLSANVYANEETRQMMRITITTSGPAIYKHYQRDNPPRIIIRFKTKNVFSKMPEDTVVNQGAIKRIQTKYYRGWFKRKVDSGGILKSLIFELKEKVPYKITQRDELILIDIANPGKEVVKRMILGETEKEEKVIEKVEKEIKAEKALAEVLSVEAGEERDKSAEKGKIAKEEIVEEITEETKQEEIKIPLLKESPAKQEKQEMNLPEMDKRVLPIILYIFASILSFAGGFFLAYNRNRRDAQKENRNLLKRYKQIKEELEAKNDLYSQIVKKYEIAKNEVENKNMLLAKAALERKTLNEELDKIKAEPIIPQSGHPKKEPKRKKQEENKEINASQLLEIAKDNQEVKQKILTNILQRPVFREKLREHLAKRS